MNHVKHPQSNFVFTAPPGMKDCDDLNVVCAHVESEPDTKLIMSYWKPTDAEIAEIVAGGHVRLVIVGQGMPPVSLSVVDAALTSV